MKSATKNGTIHYQKFATPLGDMVAASHKSRLCLLEFADKRKSATILKPLAKNLGAEIKEERSEILDRTDRQLKEYFNGKLAKFDLPINAAGTDFQKRVWIQLSKIPIGKTSNYGRIAQEVGNPRGARAAGMAIGSNPISIVIPCHRVIGKSGDLVGFGGGLWRKKWLLEHEGALPKK